MTRHYSIPALALAMPLALGCGSAGSSSGTGSGDGVAGTPMSYEHQASERPAVALPDYRYVAPGSGLSGGATATGLSDPAIDYGLALRTASLKLRGNLPSMVEMQRLQAAVASAASDGSEKDPVFVYSDIVKGYIYGEVDPATGMQKDPIGFKRQMFQFWRNTLRMGGTLVGLISDKPDDGTTKSRRNVSLDTAPSFAARLVVEDQDMRGLFTQATNTCPSFDPVTGKFTDGSCFVSNGINQLSPGNNVPEGQQAGILTNPGFLAQYYSNFGFRRARLIQELFACTRLPAEFASMPTTQGAYLYSSPWPFDSVSNNSAGHQPVFDFVNKPRKIRGGTTTTTTEYVDFRGDCQNCHSTQNHRAPLFAVFDQVGFRDPNNNFMVTSTATGSPFAQIQEYLYECNPDPKNPAAVCSQALTWRYGNPKIDIGGAQVPDFQSFAKEMAADPQSAKCMMIRAWNYAYSRDDVVNELALVPDSVINDLTGYFVKNNYNMRMALYRLYTDANFIRF